MRIVFVCLAFWAGLRAFFGAGTDGDRPTPAQALERLTAGNKRFVADKLEHPDRTQERREAVSANQQPFAAIIGCSDSRVSPEIAFDQGVGDLFVVRVAGNVVGPLELDSVKYAAGELGASLVMVLGHERCGAVKAVIDQNTDEIQSIADLIAPAVVDAHRVNGDLLENAVKINVRRVVDQIKKSPAIAKLISDGKVDVVGAYYDMDSGLVTILSDDPKPAQ